MHDQQPNSSPNAEVLEVLVIGAGFSGICSGVKLLEAGISNFKIFDKANRIGGVWHHNTYPGVACDVASHLYCFSFAPNPNWSRVFSPGAEIRDYIESVAERFDLLPKINLGAKVREIKFNDADALWYTHFESGEVAISKHIINGNGGLHVPSYPNIKGRESFKGASMHSAEWDHSVDFKGKRVAVVGSAASAVQLVPELAKVASKLTVFQRTPNYIMPRNDRDFSDKEKRRFGRFPILSKLYRSLLFYRGELLSYPLIKNFGESAYSKKARSAINEFMRLSVTDKQKHDALTPNYPAGCKRILLSDNFFTTLNRENVELVTEGVVEVQEQAVVDAQGQSHEVDVIVYATGYDIEAHMFALPVTGPKGQSLEALWKSMPRAYEAAMVSGFPNFYFTTGPNSGVGTTSVVFMIEQQVNYIIQAIKASNENGLIDVKSTVMDSFNDEIQAALATTVWSANCTSYYKREDGKITTLYPYNARTFRKRHKKIDLAQFDLTSRS